MISTAKLYDLVKFQVIGLLLKAQRLIKNSIDYSVICCIFEDKIKFIEINKNLILYK